MSQNLQDLLLWPLHVLSHTPTTTILTTLHAGHLASTLVDKRIHALSGSYVAVVLGFAHVPQQLFWCKDSTHMTGTM